MLQYELEKEHDLRGIYESEQGRLTQSEIDFPFKLEHVLKIQKTFMSFLKYQEER